jgi:hypothetical protein
MIRSKTFKKKMITTAANFVWSGTIRKHLGT